MAEDALLSDLCSICGKRDPAAFVKRNELATPSGIDHDYNFLTGIERGLQRADENAEAQSHKNKKYEQDQAKLQRYLQSNRIIVDRAPIGMTRQKTNRTRMTKKGHVRWSVEWLHDDGSRDLQEAEADMTLTDSYATLSLERSRKRKRTQQGSDGLQNPSKHSKDGHVSIQAAESHQPSQLGQPASGPTSDDTQAVVSGVSTSAEQSKQECCSAQPAPEASTAASVPGKAAGEKHSDQAPQTHTPLFSFYLLKPHTPSSQPRVLIPLDSSSTLTAALSTQVVLEYPTIKVVARQATDAPLPEGFMLEEDYIRQTKQDVQELEALIGPDGQVMTAAKVRRGNDPGDETHGNVSSGAGDGGPVDDKKLLEVLARDLNARK
ncbi:Box C/D snoRNA accumulation [Diplodia seriata]